MSTEALQRNLLTRESGLWAVLVLEEALIADKHFSDKFILLILAFYIESMSINIFNRIK